MADGRHTLVLRSRLRPGRELAIAFTPGESALDALRRDGVPVGSSCGAAGQCGRCVVRVEAAAESLSPIGDVEAGTLMRLHRPSDERLACFARVEGDGVVLSLSYL